MSAALQSLNQGLVTQSTSATNQTLQAGFTGTADTSICRFNAAGITAGSVTETTTAADGTIVLLTTPGLYHVSFSFTFVGAVAVAGGISFGAATAAAIVADPVVNVANVIASADMVSLAGVTQQMALSAIFFVTQAAATLALAGSTAAGTARVMFHATNSAGAVPVGIPVASAQYRILKLAETNQ
jgi:hypothetical protein